VSGIEGYQGQNGREMDREECGDEHKRQTAVHSTQGNQMKGKHSRGEVQWRVENKVNIERKQKILGPMRAIDTEEARKKKKLRALRGTRPAPTNAPATPQLGAANQAVARPRAST
jgi:hypothetical protein